MSSTTITAEPDNPAVAASESFASAPQNRASFVENWLNGQAQMVALAVVAVGFVIRLWVASRGYLNPDEAVHYFVINQPSGNLAYKGSLLQSHPPLLYVLLYFWHLLGHSEWMLRLPSVLAGTAACWFTFKWVDILVGRAASLIALIFMTFSPAMITLSGEVREYALLLFGMTAALYFLCLGFRDKSSRQMSYSFLFLYLAILSHYSAAFFAIATGIYAVVRIADSQPPRRLIGVWITGQAGALLLYAFLYLSQLSKLKESVAYWSVPFEEFYFTWQDGDLFFFLRHNTSNVFLYLFKQKYVSEPMLLLFAIAVMFLLLRGTIQPRQNRRSRALGILLMLPFMAIWGAAIARVYPYLGSRHTIFLAPFMIAGLSFLLSSVVRQKAWAGVLVAGLVMTPSNAAEDPSTARITAANQRRPLMIAAMNYIRASIPRAEPILVDHQSSMEAAYYLCGPQTIVQFQALDQEADTFQCDGYSMISLKSFFWKLQADNFAPAFQKSATSYRLKPGDRVWVFQAGWGANLDATLPGRFPEFRCLTSQTFGHNISIIPFLVGPDLLPVSPVNSCQWEAPKQQPQNLPVVE